MSKDREYQIQQLSTIFDKGALSPIFKPNAKYPIDGMPRIAYSDVMNRKCIVREDMESDGTNSFWDKKGKVVAEYNGIEKLVDDGWRLD